MAGTISPTSLSFLSQLVGTMSSPQSATMTSVSTTCFQFASIQTAGDFIQTNNCPALGVPAGSSCTFNIFFTPTVGGTRFGSFTGTSITGGSVYVALTGTGFSPAPVASFSSTSLSFPPQIVATRSAPQSIILSNVGNAPMTLNSISTTGDFAFASGCGTTLNAGASCAINVSFLPIAYGYRDGLLVISENADAGPQNLGLSGTGVDFYINAIPTSLSIARGESSRVTVTLNPIGGTYANPVSLSCSGLPFGSSCKFSRVSVVPGGSGASSVMTLDVGRSKSSIGNYTVTITGVSGSLIHAIQVQLAVGSKD
jgi:hypothetical protein